MAKDNLNTIENHNSSGVYAIILSAGYSSRMGEFKPLLSVGGEPAIVRLANAFKNAGVNNVIAVTGYNRERLFPVLEDNEIAEAYNKDFDKGMFGSVKTGIKTAKEIAAGKKGVDGISPSAFLLAPVDCPLIPDEVIKTLIEKHLENPEVFIVPCFQGKKGHPLVIPDTYVDEIMGHDGERGLKGVTSRHEDEMIFVETGSEAVILDMDTPKQYEEIISYSEKDDHRDWMADESGRRLFLIRHGQIRQHREKIFLGQYDPPLSETGKSQAKSVGKELSGYDISAERIYTSDLSRAVETAEIVAEILADSCKGKIEIVEDADLREMSLGKWDGRFISEIKREYPEMYERRGKDLLRFKCDNESENFYDLRYRVVKGLKKILKKDGNKDVVLVTHSGAIKSLMSVLQNTPLSEEIKKTVLNGEVKVYTFN